MERVARQYTDVPANSPPTSYRAPLNQIGLARDLATSASKDMPTANNDTLYMSAIVSLSEPFVLSVPDTHDRYYVVDVFNMWQELEHYIGRRTTGTAAGNFALVPAGWKGELPAGVKRLDVGTNKIWLWGRLRLSPGEDKDSVLALQKQFRLVPLSQFGVPDAKAQPASLALLPAVGSDELGFFAQLGAALKDNAVKPADEALFAQFARIGLTADGFDSSKLSAERRKGLVRAVQDGPAVAISAFTTATVQRNGWSWATGLDSFGFDYPLRALVAGPYLGGQGEKEAMYPLRYADSKGDVLTGASAYTVKFTSPPPVDAFWSLTVYKAGDKFDPATLKPGDVVTTGRSPSMPHGNSFIVNGDGQAVGSVMSSKLPDFNDARYKDQSGGRVEIHRYPYTDRLYRRAGRRHRRVLQAPA